jgi:hypothetical protein
MYIFYMMLKRSLPLVSASVPILCILGILRLLAWVGTICHVFDPNTELLIVYWGALLFNLFLPTKGINLFLIGMVELFLASSLQDLSNKMDTYLRRNAYIEKDAHLLVKQKKTPPSIVETEPHEAILGLRILEETLLISLNSEIKRFSEYNARLISKEGGFYLIAFRTLEEAVAYTQFVLLALKKVGVSENCYAFALDYVPLIDIENAEQVYQISNDSVLLCNLQSEGEVICTQAFLNQWNKKIKSKGFRLIKGKPNALKHRLETTIMGMYLLKGKNTPQTLYTAEIK